LISDTVANDEATLIPPVKEADHRYVTRYVWGGVTTTGITYKNILSI